MKIISLFLIMLIFTLHAKVENRDQLKTSQHILATITEDESKDVLNFVLITDKKSKNIVSMAKICLDKNGKILHKEIFEIEEINKKGIILKKQNDKDIITLVSFNFSSHNGGEGYLKYLYNGVLNKYKEFPIELVRNSKSWEIIDESSEQINHFHFKSNIIWPVGVVGIKEIVTR